MIDLHTHFLHGIDDGAQTLSESLALAKVAVADGITAAAMTPHIHPGRFDNFKTHILSHVAHFQQALNDQGIALKVYPGAEVRLGVESFEQILAGEVPFLGRVNGCDVLLLELAWPAIASEADDYRDFCRFRDERQPHNQRPNRAERTREHHPGNGHNAHARRRYAAAAAAR